MGADQRQDLVGGNEKSDRIDDAEQAQDHEARQPIAFTSGPSPQPILPFHGRKSSQKIRGDSNPDAANPVAAVCDRRRLASKEAERRAPIRSTKSQPAFAFLKEPNSTVTDRRYSCSYFSVAASFFTGRRRSVICLIRAESDGLQVATSGSSLNASWTILRS